MKHSAHSLPLAWLACSALVLSANAPRTARAQAPAAAGDTALKELVQSLGKLGIRLSPEQGLCSLKVRIGIRDDLLEYVLVQPRGQAHESLFLSEVSPRALNTALLALGVQPGQNYSVRAREPAPTAQELHDGVPAYTVEIPQGDGFYLYAAWRAGDETYLYRVEDLVRNLETGRSMQRHRWVYLGSKTAPDKQHPGQELFAAEIEGNLINLALFEEGFTLLTGRAGRLRQADHLAAQRLAGARARHAGRADLRARAPDAPARGVGAQLAAGRGCRGPMTRAQPMELDVRLRSVRAGLIQAQLAASVAQIFEAALVGISAAWIAAAARILESGSSGAAPWSDGLVAGLAAGAAWWLERRTARAELVRRIDRRRGLDGALITLWQTTQGSSGERPALASALAGRVAPKSGRAALLAAALATTPLILALPCGSAALYAAALARDSAGASAPAASAGTLGELARELRRTALERRAQVPGDATAGAALALAEAAQASPTGSQPAASTGIAQPGTDELRASATRLAQAAQPGSELQRALRRLEAALAPAALPSGAGPAGPSAATGAPGPGASGSAGLHSAGSGAPADPGAGVSGAAPNAQDPAARVAPASAATDAPASISNGPWWDPRYDAVVQRWIEARRILR
jgi:hypothetical protein